MHLFGKTPDASEPSGFRNCAVVVNGIDRNVFLLLKDQSETTEEEWNNRAEAAFAEFKAGHLSELMFEIVIELCMF